MEEDKKSHKDKNIVYALADYRQLVLQYRTKHSELIKAVVFWRTTAVWLAAVCAGVLLFALAVLNETARQASHNRQGLATVSGRMQALSAQLENWQQELKATRAELERKEAQINQLEKNLSTVSKKQVERLLKESEPAKQPGHIGE